MSRTFEHQIAILLADSIGLEDRLYSNYLDGVLRKPGQ